MKRATFFAAALLMGAAVTASPLQVMAAGNINTNTMCEQKINSVVIGSGTNMEGLKEYLESCGLNNVHVITIPCIPGSSQLPENGNPDGNCPEVEIPEVEIPEVEIPDIEIPDVEIPDAEIPDAESPEVEIPGSGKPEVNLPESGEPETDTPENNGPTTNTPEVNNPDTENPGNGTPETEQPDVEQSYHAYVLRVVELVNEERAKAGLNALTLQENVTEAAQVRAVECETLFSHTRPDGSSFSTALKEAGVSYKGAGENIAWGQKSPEAVMEAWMNSEGHKANILNEKYNTIGVGYYQNGSGVNYWSQLFTY